jgi:16S rRNA (adenine1518-N6/adenine1519-N6)-dimethyltransferase
MNLPAKKSLGQNFLKSKEALRDIITAADIRDTDTILEIGPGKGALTIELLKQAGKVIAIEKDDRMIEYLSELFKSDIDSGKLELIAADILEYNPTIRNYKIVANIPYYITGALLQKFLESDNQPSRMVLLLQKEVAERIVARDNKESILSMSVKVFGTPKYIAKVAAKYFSPQPKVDSAILLIKDISKQFFLESGISEQRFFEIMKAGFAHKRKILMGNLKTAFPDFSGEELKKAFENVKINEKARAEDIGLLEWKLLIQNL